MFRPGELGLAQAYVTGEIDVEGDLLDGFRRVWQSVREDGASPRLNPTALAQGLRTAFRLGAIGVPPAPPASQARLRGRLHSARRDRDAISHHYDLSNDFYSLILDPHMAYSCAYFTSDAADYTLEDAQRDKLDLVARKLGLTDAAEGHRHLDIGCGWGSMSLHLAQEYGVKVVGVTIAAEQKAFIDARIKERGLEDRVEIRLQDYRDVVDGPFDTITSIEMGEHVGKKNYPVFTGGIHRLLARRRSCAGAADVAHHRARAAVPSSRPSSPPTCTCAPSARPSTSSSGPGSRCATCTRCASTTCAPSTPGTPPSRTTGTTPSRWSARRSLASGGSTSSAVRWRSRRAAWASTRS